MQQRPENNFFEIAGLFCKAYTKAATVEKAVVGFESSGIWPYDDNKFTDEDFAPSYLTDEARPDQSVQLPLQSSTPVHRAITAARRA